MEQGRGEERVRAHDTACSGRQTPARPPSKLLASSAASGDTSTMVCGPTHDRLANTCTLSCHVMRSHNAATDRQPISRPALSAPPPRTVPTAHSPSRAHLGVHHGGLEHHAARDDQEGAVQEQARRLAEQQDALGAVAHR